MGNKRETKRNHFQSGGDQNLPSPPAEDKRSVAVTVGWMMATLATGAAICFSAVAYALTRSLLHDAGPRHPLAALPGMLLFIASVMGVLTLILIPVVYRLRPTKPPLPVTVGSVCVAISPWIVIVVRAWTS